MDIGSKLVKTGDIPPTDIFTVYGRGGTGKTTFASSFPKPILYLDIKDRGTDSIRDVDGIDVLPINDWDEIELAFWWLKKHRRRYRTIVWDTISQAQDLAIYKLLEKKGMKIDSGKVGNWGTMRRQDYGDVASRMKTWILSYKDLAVDNHMKLVFIAMDRTFGMSDEEDVDNEISPEIGPRVMPSIMSTLNGNSSMVVNTFIRRHTERKRIGKKVKVRSELQYTMRVGPHEYYLTKMRKPKGILLPQVVVDPTYDRVMQLINRGGANGSQDKDKERKRRHRRLQRRTGT